MNDEDFDGSALRELLTPAVADHGRTSAPTDAIVAAGRRRVVGRRSAVAGGALAIVAAVPLAASALAAGSGTAAGPATGAAGNLGIAAATTPSTTPTHSTAPLKENLTWNAAGLPAQPTVIASGTVEGRNWSVIAERSAGNNTLTAGDACLGLIVKVDGRYSVGGPGPMLPYCYPLPTASPNIAAWAYQETLKYDFTGGAGTLQMGMVDSDVAKVVAHVDALAPVSAATVPAPGLGGKALYFLSIPKDEGFRVSFDEYDTQGVKIGTFDNSTPNPFPPASPTSGK